MTVLFLQVESRSALKFPVMTLFWYNEIKANRVSKSKYGDRALGRL